jgi:hypothetical protein
VFVDSGASVIGKAFDYWFDSDSRLDPLSIGEKARVFVMVKFSIQAEAYLGGVGVGASVIW